MRILAIDPGYERVGIAILEKSQGKRDALIYSNCFKTKASKAFHDRLSDIGDELEDVIQKYKPEALAIEKLYLSTNQKTAMNVAEARGVMIYIASQNGLDIYEYTPPQIKVAVTGYGKASKDMIMSMVPKLIKIESPIKSDDEMDALAIGLTCLACEKFSTGK
ncbi:MAG: crossover junction endodeoxyribonuclease RuvC [bacterium]